MVTLDPTALKGMVSQVVLHGVAQPEGDRALHYAWKEFSVSYTLDERGQRHIAGMEFPMLELTILVDASREVTILDEDKIYPLEDPALGKIIEAYLTWRALALTRVNL